MDGEDEALSVPRVPQVEFRLPKLAGVGKPFELVLNDAITRRRIATEDLRGKAVVVEIWATWCGPYVEEMPKLKALYERFRKQGVEFIGISLDRRDGGLELQKDFVKKQQIPWPRFYLCEGGEKVPAIFEGVQEVPTVWMVDQEGKFVSVHARGKLETMIPELLKQGWGEAKLRGPGCSLMERGSSLIVSKINMARGRGG